MYECTEGRTVRVQSAMYAGSGDFVGDLAARVQWGTVLADDGRIDEVDARTVGQVQIGGSCQHDEVGTPTCRE